MKKINELDGSHPIWAIIRQVVIFAGAATILYVNANKFDITEIRSLFWLLLVQSSTETVMNRISNREPS